MRDTIIQYSVPFIHHRMYRPNQIEQMKIIKSHHKPDITAADRTPVKELLSPLKDTVGTRYSVALARLAGAKRTSPTG